MGEKIILEAIQSALQKRDALHIRKGVTPDLLLILTANGIVDVPYSRRQIYNLCNRLVRAGKLQKLHYGGYAPLLHNF